MGQWRRRERLIVPGIFKKKKKKESRYYLPACVSNHKTNPQPSLILEDRPRNRRSKSTLAWDIRDLRARFYALLDAGTVGGEEEKRRTRKLKKEREQKEWGGGKGEQSEPRRGTNERTNERRAGLLLFVRAATTRIVVPSFRRLFRYIGKTSALFQAPLRLFPSSRKADSSSRILPSFLPSFVRGEARKNMDGGRRRGGGAVILPGEGIIETQKEKVTPFDFYRTARAAAQSLED